MFTEILKSRSNKPSTSKLDELDALHPLSSVMNINWTFSLTSLSSLILDTEANRYYLTIHFQTYVYALIEPFVSWIATYSDQIGTVGYCFENEAFTTRLIRFEDGKAYWVGIEAKEQREMERSNI